MSIAVDQIMKTIIGILGISAAILLHFHAHAYTSANSAIYMDCLSEAVDAYRNGGGSSAMMTSTDMIKLQDLVTRCAYRQKMGSFLPTKKQIRSDIQEAFDRSQTRPKNDIPNYPPSYPDGGDGEATS